MSYYEDDIKIKQLLPLPEGLSPMIRFDRKDGSKKYEDAQINGWSVLYALVRQGENDEVRFCLLDPNGDFELVEGTEVRNVPSVKCIKCGQKMTPREMDDHKVLYTCNCRAIYNPHLTMTRRWFFDNNELDEQEDEA